MRPATAALTGRGRPAAPWLRFLAAAAAVLALKSFVLDPLTGHFGGSVDDFSAYLGAARSMAVGGSPYAQFSPATVVMSGFIYPPFSALLVRPLALFDDRTAMTVWMLVTLGCAVGGAIVLARTTLPRSWPAAELGILAVLAFAPATYNYWHGQINPVVFLLLVLAQRAYVRERPVACGSLLGLAAGIKIAPLVLIVLLLRRRWWRGSAAMLVTGALTEAVALLALGTQPTVTFLTRILPALNRATGWIYDQSLGGALSRVADQSVLYVQSTSAGVQVLSAAAGLAVLGLAARATRSGWRSPEQRAVEYGLGILAMVLAGGIAWYPVFMHLLIPLFTVLGIAAARGWRAERSLVVAAAGVLLVWGLIAPMAITQLSMAGVVGVSRSAAWWPFVQLCSLPCLSTLGLLAVLARRLVSAPVPGRPAPERLAAGAAG